MERVLSGPVGTLAEYSRPNELAFRAYAETELAQKYDKRSNIVIPYGKTLSFAGTSGQSVVLGYNGSDFTIAVDGAAAISLASGSSVTTLQTEVTNARSGEANLLARLTTINTTATNAGTAAATAQSEITAAREGETSLLAKVNVIESAIVTGDAAVASSVTTLTATVNAKNQTFIQTSAPTAIAAGDLWIDSDDNNRLYRATAAGSGSWVAVPYTDTGKVTTFAQNDAPTALAVGDLWIDTNDSNKVYRATAPGSGSWSAVDDARISINATAIATVDGKLSASYGVTVDAGGRVSSLKLLSDGTTSSFAVTASTFLVYDGTSSNDAVFEITGGKAKLKAAHVGVLTAGHISTSTLSAITSNLGDITGGSIRLTSGSYVVHIDAGFGVSSDLLMWFGLSSVAEGSATKTNGVFALGTDGKAYHNNAELSSPVKLSFSAAINDTSSPYTGTITVTATGGSGSYTYLWYKGPDEAGISASFANTTTATVTISASLGAGDDSTGRAYVVVTDSAGSTAVGSQAYNFSDLS
jgi:hypothetical protein